MVNSPVQWHYGPIDGPTDQIGQKVKRRPALALMSPIWKCGEQGSQDRRDIA